MDHDYKESKYDKKGGGKRDRGADRDDFGGGDEKSSFTRRRRGRPAIDAIFDYKDLDTLNQYISEDGKIVAARITRLNNKQQKTLSKAIKRARHLALIPICSVHMN